MIPLAHCRMDCLCDSCCPELDSSQAVPDTLSTYIDCHDLNDGLSHVWDFLCELPFSEPDTQAVLLGVCQYSNQPACVWQDQVPQPDSTICRQL